MQPNSEVAALAQELAEVKRELARKQRYIDSLPARPWLETDHPDVIACMGSAPACAASGCQLAALDASREPKLLEKEMEPTETPVGTYACPVCGLDTPHSHEPVETLADAARLNGCALREFGRHLVTCSFFTREADGIVRPYACNCGLQVALDAALRRDHERMAAASLVSQEAAPREPAPNVQTFGCYTCKRNFQGEPKVASVPGIPAQTYFFCSYPCMTRWYQPDSGGNSADEGRALASSPAPQLTDE